MNTILSPFRVALWIIWTVVCITIAFIATSLTLNRKTAVWLSRHLWSGGTLLISGIKLHVTGHENVDYSKPHVYIANHQSYMDIPCIMNAVDNHLYFIAKKELRMAPFLGWFIWLSGMIFIDRSNRRKALESIRIASKKIRDGRSILTFPEETRSKDGNLNSFKKGAFLMALEANVSIVPISISGTEKICPATKVVLTPGNVSLHIGQPISVDGYSRWNIGELMEKAKLEIECQKEALKVI